MDLNRVTLMGRLGADPELKTTGSGVSVCRLSVATTDKRQNEEHVEWHRVIVWEKMADACGKYLHKGSRVFIEGRIASREYEPKEGGKRQVFEIVANNVTFLDKPSDKATEPNGEPCPF